YFLERWVIDTRHALSIAVTLHIIQKAADVLSSEIAFQRPRGIRVAEGRSDIWYVTVHYSFVGHRLRQFHWRTVYYQLQPAHQLQHQPCGCYNDVGIELLARLEL